MCHAWFVTYDRSGEIASSKIGCISFGAIVLIYKLTIAMARSGKCDSWTHMQDWFFFKKMQIFLSEGEDVGEMLNSTQEN